MEHEDIRTTLADAALTVGRAITAAVRKLPLHECAVRVPSPLKPPPSVSAKVDFVGEDAAFRILKQLGGLLDLPIRVVVDPASGHYIELPSGSRGTSSDGRPLHQQHQYHQQQRRQQDRHDGARQRPGPGPGSGGSGSSDGTGVSPRGNATELPPGPTLARGTPPDAGDDDSGASQPLPQQQQQQQQLHIWVYLDAVDGTVKLAGLGNEPSRLRVINDSTWAVGIAMTDPTRAGLDELRLRDFKIAAIVDGSFGPSGRAAGGSGARGLGQADGRIHGAAWQAPHSEISYPAEVIACWQDDVPAPAGSGGDSPTGWWVTRSGYGEQLYMSSCRTLSQTFCYLDCFQGYDRTSARAGDEAMARGLHGALSNRHEGGAFDVIRMYGNLSSLQRCMLGYRPSGPGGRDYSSSGGAVLRHRSRREHGGWWSGGSLPSASGTGPPPPAGRRVSDSPHLTLTNGLATLEEDDTGTEAQPRGPVQQPPQQPPQPQPPKGTSRAARRRRRKQAGLRGDDGSGGGSGSGTAGASPKSGRSWSGRAGMAAAAAHLVASLGGDGDGAAATTTDEDEETLAASMSEVWLEAQCGVFVVVNENLANLIPCIPIVLGAGGLATDLSGQPLASRRLTDGRTSVLYAANEELRRQAMTLVTRVQGTGGGGTSGGGAGGDGVGGGNGLRASGGAAGPAVPEQGERAHSGQ